MGASGKLSSYAQHTGTRFKNDLVLADSRLIAQDAIALIGREAA